LLHRRPPPAAEAGSRSRGSGQNFRAPPTARQKFWEPQPVNCWWFFALFGSKKGYPRKGIPGRSLRDLQHNCSVPPFEAPCKGMKSLIVYLPPYNPSVMALPCHLRNSVRLGCFYCAMPMVNIFVPVRLYSLGQIVPLTGAPAKAGTKAICLRSLRLHEKPRLARPPFLGRLSAAAPEVCNIPAMHSNGERFLQDHYPVTLHPFATPHGAALFP
jgi:hypothetical protein